MTTTEPPDDNYQPPRDEQDDGSSSEEQTALVRIDQSGLASIAKSEAMAQVDVAHTYPRDLKRFEKRSIEMATFDQATAKLCMYTLARTEWDPVLRKRVKKDIVGPSIRLAEIVASSYQNIHVVSRLVDIGETTVTCLGAAWDLENNLKVGAEVSRGITSKGGKRYGNDMIVVTIAAASAIARRNAIFSVVSRAYVNRIFERVREVATGSGKPIQVRREGVIAPFAKLGVDVARILARVDRASIDEIGVEDLEVLAGLWTRLKQGEPVDTVFPLPEPKEQAPVPGSEPAQQGQRIDLGGAKPAVDVQATPIPVPQAATPQPVPVVATPVQPAAEAPAVAQAPVKAQPARRGAPAQINFGGDPERAAGAPTAAEEAKLGPQPGSEIT